MRIITHIAIDLSFSNMPFVKVDFTDRDEKTGHESPNGTLQITDDAARKLIPVSLIDDVIAACKAKEDELTDPGTVAARITAASEAEKRSFVASRAADAAEASQMAAEDAQAKAEQAKADADTAAAQAIAVAKQAKADADAAAAQVEAKKAEFAALQALIDAGRR